MSFVITDPDAIGTAADELQTIGSELTSTNTAVAPPTTGVLPPGTDSVSVRAAALLDAHAQQYQALSAQAEMFHNQFVQTLLTAKNAYAETEVSNAATMQLTTNSPATSPNDVALIMGGTGDSTPSNAYLTAIDNAYLAQHYPGYTLVGLKTPEQFFPLTGSESFGKSVQQGMAILNNAIMTQTAAGNRVVVVGYSQSATIATMEMRYLDALPSALRPNPNLLNFVLLADPNNPVTGGILTHFAPGIGAFQVVTPVNPLYATSIYTLQYDGVGNFPSTLFNIPSVLNALFGVADLHTTVPYLSAAQVAAATVQHIGNTTYYMIGSANLPLLNPLRAIPILGNPLADLLQPFLRPIVDLGYTNPFAMPALHSIGAAVGQGATAGIISPLVAGLPPLAANGLVDAV
ncbi:hypothetical protein MRAB57_5147 [Mycobacterium rhizamassiliense]|jgi:hypothetical protein|uniref:PE family protein n=1 Tax=Mycobacterium rhizamassiliense TaxID=1841860 RepID=A0A2U3P0N8_9MYCO|nr:PE-PPE domain-containing protein [Mycobacterium rhizamassiliense]SPM37304.1 hypothetical protein MRAB57_5147 [Mycobacterium rhizamassiliense]